MTKRIRLRAALGLVALYAFCVLAPHAAMALGSGAAQCLTGDNAAAHIHKADAQPTAHTHEDGLTHTHASLPSHDDSGAPLEHSDVGGKNHSGSCCGLFCMSAISLEPGVTLPTPVSISPALPGRDYALAGRGPDRLIRPPIA